MGLELTIEDINEMQKEMDHRVNVIRPQISSEIKRAKEFGDLSENAEYHEARRAKGKNESRIKFLKDTILTAKIIKTNPDENSIGIRDEVEVFFEDDNETEIIKLETTVGQNPYKNMYSKESPFGQAILGRHVGDRVKVVVEDSNDYYVVIKSIKKCK